MLLGHRDREREEVHCSLRPGPWLVEGLGEGSGDLQDIVPSLVSGSSSSLTDLKLGKIEGLQEKP